MRTRSNRREVRASGGFTLIEVIVVMAIIGLVASIGVGGFRAIAKSELRGSANRLAGTIRYLFDRASSTGKMHRLVIDFDEGAYWAEESDDQYYMPRERETEKARQEEADRLAEEAEAEKDKEEDGTSSSLGTESAYDLSSYQPEEFKPKRARFSAFRETTLKKIKVAKIVKLAGLYTPRLAEPMTSGRGYIYFYPLGMTEAGIVHVSDDDGETFFSLIVHPLTGRVQVLSGYVAAPVDEQLDDAGEKVIR